MDALANEMGATELLSPATDSESTPLDMVVMSNILSAILAARFFGLRWAAYGQRTLQTLRRAAISLDVRSHLDDQIKTITVTARTGSIGKDAYRMPNGCLTDDDISKAVTG